MSRLLVVLLVACSSAEAVTSSETTPSVWIDRWIEARDCMVVPAEDLETGIAISFLERRDCDAELQALARNIPVSDDPLVKEWRLAIGRLRRIKVPSAAQRSVEIRIVEVGARLIGALYGRDLPAMRRGPALPQAHQHKHAVKPWLAKLGPRVYGVESGPFKVAVNLESPHYEMHANEMTNADGTWMHVASFGYLYEIDLYDAPPALEQLVSRDGTYYLERLVPDGSPISSTALDLPPNARPYCHHHDVVWWVTVNNGPWIPTAALHRSGAEREIGVIPLAGLVRCTAERLVVDLPDHVQRCNNQACRTEFVSPVPKLEGHSSLLADGRWVFGVTLEHVAAIWIEGQQPRYFRPTTDPSWDSLFDGVVDLEIDGHVIPLAVSKHIRDWR